MAEEKLGSRVGSLVIGGVVGWMAAAAASRARGRRAPGPRIPGLAAFEQAPCFEEAVREVPEPTVREP
jgi:hypothetical protein